jgi:hypothetical protein
MFFFSAVIFFQFLVIKALDPDPDPYCSPDSTSGSGSGSVKNEYGSETLKGRPSYRRSLHIQHFKKCIFKTIIVGHFALLDSDPQHWFY